MDEYFNVEIIEAGSTNLAFDGENGAVFSAPYNGPNSEIYKLVTDDAYDAYNITINKTSDLAVGQITVNVVFGDGYQSITDLSPAPGGIDLPRSSDISFQAKSTREASLDFSIIAMGGDVSFGEPAEMLWYQTTSTPSAGSWSVRQRLDSTGETTPSNPEDGSAVSERRMAYDPVNEKLVYHSQRGFYGDYPSNVYVTTWEYDIATNTWASYRNYDNTGPYYYDDVPENQELGGAPLCWDGVNDKIVLWATEPSYLVGPGGTWVTRLWEYDVTTHVWTEITNIITGDSLPTPYQIGAIHDGALVWDEFRQKIWLYTADDTYTPGVGFTSYKIGLYDPSARTYTDLTVGGTPDVNYPEARAQFGAAYDPVNQEFLITHGQSPQFGGDPYYADTWTFNGTIWTARAGVADDPSVITDPDEGVVYPSHRISGNAVTADGGVYLMPGYSLYSGILQNNLWFWNGSSWTKVSEGDPRTRTHMTAVGKYPSVSLTP